MTYKDERDVLNKNVQEEREHLPMRRFIKHPAQTSTL
jgi:hypothetical protein